MATLKQRVSELETANAALQARIEVAIQVYRTQKARIAELEAQLAARGAAKQIPSVWEWTSRDGSKWRSTRIGTRTTSVQIA